MTRLAVGRFGSVPRAFQWCARRNLHHIATSLALIAAAGLILYGLVWLDDAYEVSRFTLAPSGCPLARVSVWNSEVESACWAGGGR